MLIAWVIGIILNLILVFIWNSCYIKEYGEYTGCRIPVNILVAILFIVLTLIPVLNIFSAIFFTIVFVLRTECYCIEWRVPKWMTKEIK